MCGSFKIDILGSRWDVCIVEPSDDDRLENTDGFCDWTDSKIVIANRMNEGNLQAPWSYLLKVIRHELVHAFMRESGLGECAFNDQDMEEIMVDWIAIQWYKIEKAIDEATTKARKIVIG